MGGILIIVLLTFITRLVCCPAATLTAVVEGVSANVIGFGLAGAIFTTVLAGHEALANPWLFAGVRAGFVGAMLVGILGTLVTALRE